MQSRGPGHLAEPLRGLGELEPHIVTREDPCLTGLGERHPRPDEKRLDRGERDPHGLGDLGVGESVDLAQHEGAPLRLRQLLDVGDDRPQLLAPLDALERGRPVRIRVDVHRVLPVRHRLPQEVQAPITRDPVQPWPSRDRPLVGEHRRMGCDEGLLEQILGVLARADHVPAEAEQPRLVAVEQDLERVVVAVANHRDELLVALQA